ncbi:hypothetical protein Q604_UNBC08960G0001, partial [human gut metagenome]
QSGRYGRAALESLKSDAEYMKDPKRARDLLMALDGEQHLHEQVSEKVLAENVLIAPGSGKPDTAFWSALIQDRYNVMTCIEKDACVLVEQELNSDGWDLKDLQGLAVIEDIQGGAGAQRVTALDHEAGDDAV